MKGPRDERVETGREPPEHSGIQPAAPRPDAALGETLAPPDVAVDETMAPVAGGGGVRAVVVGGAVIELPDADAKDYGELRPVDPSDYAVEGLLARGGMGAVLRARDRRLGRPVAIKIAQEASLVARFEREARLTARLQHPSIVNVHEAGRWGPKSPFYAMTRVEGRTLEDLIREAGTLQRRLALLPRVMDVVDAIAYAHAARVIHRDLKPANVLVGEYGETIVIDWGLAKDLASGEVVSDERDGAPRRDAAGALETAAGDVLGTPAFMAPEQARGEPADERADVYALGAVLRNLLTGRPPFEGTSAVEVLGKVLAGPPAPFGQVAPEVPRDLAAIVEKAMARDPGQRYPTAKELSADLKSFLDGQLVRVHRYTRWELLRRFARRHRAAVTVGALALLALLSVGGASLVRIARARRAAAVAHRETELATRQLLENLEERGRTELVAGVPLRPALHLAEAYRRGRRGAALSHLLGEAMGPIDALRFTIDQSRVGVRWAAFDPAGERIATAGADGVGRIWDARTGDPIRALRPGHDDKVLFVGWSPDGTRVVTTSVDRTARVWEAGTGRLLASLEGHTDRVTAASWSPDGSLLVTSSADGTARVWPSEGGGGRSLAEGHGDWVTSACFTPDGGRIVTASDDARVRIWDAATGRLVKKLEGRHEKWVAWASVSPDGGLIASAGWHDRTVQLWDARTFEPGGALVGHEGPVRSVFFRADGREILTAGADGTVRVWDTASLRQAHILRGHTGRVFSAQWSPDGRSIVTASADGTLRVWDAGARPLLWTASGLDRPPFVLAFSPDGRTIAAGAAGHSVGLWDARTGRPVRTLGSHAKAVRAIGFSPDGRRLLTASEDRVAMVSRVDASGSIPLQHPRRVFAAAWSADGRTIATGDDVGAIRIWDPATGVPVDEWRSPRAELHAVAFDPSGRRLVSGGEDRVLRVWDVASHGLLLQGERHTDTIYDAAFDPPGKRIASASADGSVLVWDADTGRVLVRLEGHVAPVWSVAWSPEGARLVTASEDRSARIWEAASGRLLAVHEAHPDFVYDAQFRPDGGAFASVSGDGSLHLWRAHLERRAPAAIERLLRERLGVELGASEGAGR